MNIDLEIFGEIFQDTLIIYFGILLGYIWTLSPLKAYNSKFVSVTINFLVPILIITSMINIEFTGNEWLFPVGAAIIVTITGILVPKIIANIRSQDPPSPAELCTSSFSNALNFPYPIIFAFSPDALGVASIFLATAVIMRNTVGLVISGVKFRRQNFKEIVTFPPLLAIIAGIILNPRIEVENTDGGLYYLIIQIGIIATLMTVGFSLQRPDFSYKIPIVRVAISRYVVSGFIAIVIINLFSLSQNLSIAIFVQMIAPPAVYNGLYAQRFKLDTHLTSQIIVTLTFAALIFLPFELFIVQTMFVK